MKKELTQRQKDLIKIKRLTKPKKSHKYISPTKQKIEVIKVERQYTKAKLAFIYSQELIKNATKAEKIMIEILDYQQVKYEFQKPIQKGNSFYIVDFFISTPTKPLIIEIDGYRHYIPEGVKKDKNRTFLLKKWTNCEILRFANSLLIDKPDKVLEFVLFKLNSLKI